MDLANGIPSRAIYELPRQTDIFCVKIVRGCNLFFSLHSSHLLENPAEGDIYKLLQVRKFLQSAQREDNSLRAIVHGRRCQSVIIF